MEYEKQPYIVYIKIDNQNRIIAVNSSAFMHDTNEWIEIDSGFGTRYLHAQGYYFPQPIYDERGICRYLHTPDSETLWRERTQEEMNADWVKPVPTPNPNEKISQLEQQVAALSAALLNL